MITAQLAAMRKKQPAKHGSLHGIILLNKPQGYSSNSALQKLKYALQVKKAGHTGTLDPMATGLLPICLGQATKYAHFLLNADKSYHFTMRLGIKTTTADSEGEILSEQAVPAITERQANKICEGFIGAIKQIPPMYSALKHQGQPLYKLAREGVSIERPARDVTIHQLLIIEQREQEWDCMVRCSKGTYIRTLAEDIGDQLGCGAHLIKLHRSAIGGLHQPAMHDLDSLINKKHHQPILSVDHLLTHLPAITLPALAIRRLQNGKSVALAAHQKSDTTFRLYNGHRQFVGIASKKKGRLTADKMWRSVNTDE